MCPDDEAPSGGLVWAILSGHVSDGQTSQPISAPITFQSEFSSAVPKVFGNSLIGLVAIPNNFFSELLEKNYTVQLKIAAPGYVTLDLPVSLLIDKRKLLADVFPGDTIVSLDDTSKLSAGEMLLIGPPDQFCSRKIVSVNGPQVLIDRELKTQCNAGEPASPVIPDNFKPLDIGELILDRQ
jgi:hypothetical protein